MHTEADIDETLKAAGEALAEVVGGVEVNLRGEDQIREAFDRIEGNVRRRLPSAEVQGIPVQEMGSPGPGPRDRGRHVLCRDRVG